MSPGAIAAGALDPKLLYRPQSTRPRDQGSVTRCVDGTDWVTKGRPSWSIAAANVHIRVSVYADRYLYLVDFNAVIESPILPSDGVTTNRPDGGQHCDGTDEDQARIKSRHHPVLA